MKNNKVVITNAIWSKLKRSTMKPSKKKPAKRAVRRGGDTPLGMLIMKLKKLATAIEMKKGPSMNIDDHDYRWVDDRINYLQSEGRKLNKDEMNRANQLWKKYNGLDYEPDIEV